MNYENDYVDDSDADDDYPHPINQSSKHPTNCDTSPSDSNPASNEITPTTYTHSATGHPSPSCLITQWTADQCADYVASLGADYEDYADTFVGTLAVRSDDGLGRMFFRHALTGRLS